MLRLNFGRILEKNRKISSQDGKESQVLANPAGTSLKLKVTNVMV